MAADSDGVLKAVVICEGDLHDPDFPQKFRSLLGQLKSILDPPKRKKRFLKVDKVSAAGAVLRRQRIKWLTLIGLFCCRQIGGTMEQCTRYTIHSKGCGQQAETVGGRGEHSSPGVRHFVRATRRRHCDIFTFSWTRNCFKN